MISIFRSMGLLGKLVIAGIGVVMVFSAIAIASTVFHLIEIGVVVGLGLSLYRASKNAKRKLSGHRSSGEITR